MQLGINKQCRSRLSPSRPNHSFPDSACPLAQERDRRGPQPPRGGLSEQLHQCAGAPDQLLIVTNYREAYGLHVCTGIMANHESPLPPSRFVA